MRECGKIGRVCVGLLCSFTLLQAGLLPNSVRATTIPLGKLQEVVTNHSLEILTPALPSTTYLNVGSAAAVTYLSGVMDQFHGVFDVYSDADAAGNHFAARGRINPSGNETICPAMDEACTDNPHSGITCIEAAFKGKGVDWDGWYLMNGVLHGSDTTPQSNWGDESNAGIDLRGATKLTFWVRGLSGGERVEFFCFGVGRNADTGAPTNPYPDSSPKVSTGYIYLSTQWTEYTIDLYGRDLRYVLGGFGWVTNATNNGNQDITFFLDDIRYDKARLSDPRFLVSYKTVSGTNPFDMVARNTAFTYDNAIALLAFLASGENQRAKLLADALVYATQHDRSYTDGRIRNAYQGGDLVLPPGWTPNGRVGTVRMPGWYDPQGQQWLEDKVQVSTYTGNVAWAMLALLAYYESLGGDQYLAAAETMGDWVETNCRVGDGIGYTAGFEDWEPALTGLTYKSTEHNLDLYAAFQRLYLITGDEKWRERASNAKQFIALMWDPAEGKFYTGTLGDGNTRNEAVIPVDVQAWAVLALRGEGQSYWGSLDYAENHLKVGGGFDFNQDCDGVWFEGTAQMAAAYKYTGQQTEYQNLISFLKAAQDIGGGLVATNNENGLTTGFYLPNGDPWLYFKRLHVGATGWLVLAENGVNPFWMGHENVPVTKLLGADDTAITTPFSANYLVLDRYAVVATGNVTQIRVKCTTSGSVKVALYTDSAGSPGNLITANNTGASVVAGWNTISIPSTPVISGTYYWIAYNSTPNCVGFIAAPGSGLAFQPFSYATDFPASAGTGFATYTIYHSLTAGWGTAGPTPLAITTTSLPDGVIGVAYSQTLHASGGTGSYTWSITSGSLPAGLTLTPSSGLISGTPIAAGISSFTVQVNDGSTTANQPFSITVTVSLQKLLGADDTAITTPFSANYLVLDRYAVVATGNVTQIRVKCTTSGSVKVALYTDSAGSPGNLITANNTGASVVAGWNTISIPSTPVISGTYYWIAYNSTPNCVGYVAAPGSGLAFQPFSYATDFPASAGTGFYTYTIYRCLSAGWGTSTPPTPPDAPSLLSPGTAITFTWGTSTCATTYWLQVNNALDFSGTNAFDAEVGNITTQEVTGLSIGTIYYWRVKAGNISGWSTWSSARSVAADVVP